MEKLMSTEIIKTLINNFKWIFSGIGVLIVTLIINYIYKKKKTKTIQKQVSGNNSINNQGKNINQKINNVRMK